MPTFEDVRELSMALPEVEEIITWDVDITFRVRKKIFAIGGDGADRISVKATLDQQADQVTGTTGKIVPAMCVFTKTGC